MSKKSQKKQKNRKSEEQFESKEVLAAYFRRQTMTDESAEKYRNSLVAQGLLKPNDQEYKAYERTNRKTGATFLYQERPSMPAWMVAKLRKKLIESGIIRVAAGFQKLIDQGVLYPSSVYGNPQYVEYQVKLNNDRRKEEEAEEGEL